MKTDVRETSLEAYDENRRKGSVCRQAQAIVDFITRSGGDWSLQEISRAMGAAKYPINVVSGRVNACKNAVPPLLEEAPARPCSVTGRKITPVRIPVRPPAIEQLKLFERAAA